MKSEANLYTSKIKSFEKYCEDLNSSNTFLQSSIEYYRQLMAEKAHILKSLKVKLWQNCTNEFENYNGNFYSLNYIELWQELDSEDDIEEIEENKQLEKQIKNQQSDIFFKNGKVSFKFPKVEALDNLK